MAKKPRNLMAAAKVIDNLCHPLYLMRKFGDGQARHYAIGGTAKSMLQGGAVEIIQAVGVPAIIEAVDHALDLYQQLRTVGYNFARFLMDHPAAPVLLPQNFSPDSREYEVLMHIHAVAADAEMRYTQRENYDGDPDLVDEIDDSPEAECGTLLSLAEMHFCMINDDISGFYVHLPRGGVWSIISVVEPHVRALVKIRTLLEPLMEGAAP
jgi:hypothetical protein